MEVFPKITVDPGMCAGKPCIRGFRITVEHVLALLSEGATFAELLREWPFLEEDDLRAALRYASYLAGDRTLAVAS